VQAGANKAVAGFNRRGALFSLGVPGSARPQFFTGAQPFSRIRVADSRPFGAIAADHKEFT